MKFIVIPVFSVIDPFTDRKAYAHDYSVVAMIGYYNQNTLTR